MAFPEDPAHWNLLLKTANELGDTAGIKRAQLHLNGKEDIYVAQSTYGTIKLLGKIDSAGNFTSFIWDNVSGIDTTGNSQRYKPMQPAGLDKQLITILATCHWGKYSASFAAGKIGSAESLGSNINWISFGSCPKDTILTTQVHEQGKRKGAGSATVDVFSIRQKINNNKAESKNLEDSAYIYYCQNTARSDRNNGDITTVQPLSSFHTILLNPFPSMNLFEAIAKVAVPGMRDSGPYFEEIVGLFDERGAKIYPPVVANPFPANSGESNASKLCFFTFPKRGDGRVYTVYRYFDPDGSGGNYCYDLLCFQEGEKMVFFTIEKYWDGD
jgi:hypothetical protein